MANSIFQGKAQPTVQPATPQINMLKQLQSFRQTIKGNPQQAVMKMLSQGTINNNQLQQAVAQARQIQNMLK